MASFLAALAVAYEMAVARVPRQRAAFESLVRAQTGLDIRFNELAFRLGWYGPEAVFRRVELGEPGQSNVLLRAPQLIVGINAWQTMRLGRPRRWPHHADRAGYRSREAGARAAREQRDRASTASAPQARRRKSRASARSLEGRRHRPAGRHAQGARSRRRRESRSRCRSVAQHSSVQATEWSGHALVFLPERLGRTARVVFQLNGDINSPASFSGGVRFEGVRLSFSSWRGVLGQICRGFRATFRSWALATSPSISR